MNQLVTSDNFVSQADAPVQPHITRSLWIRRLTIPLILGAVFLYLCAPLLLWSYNIDRAGRALERGLVWPTPRTVDSLPAAGDVMALESALGHLAAAVHWRPNDAYAHRLAAEVYAARQDWPKALDELARAHSLAPQQPLVIWNSALVYEHLADIVATAPRASLLPELSVAPVSAPAIPLDTGYCRDRIPATCYVALDQYTQPYAATPDGAPLRAKVLFMYPPSAVRLPYTIAADQPVLQFLMGMDPNIRLGQSDGVTYQIWIESATEQRRMVFEQTLDGETARRGWVPGQVDLAAWAGTPITLELGLTGGPFGAVADDWYGWGNVQLTTVQAVAAEQLLARSSSRPDMSVTGLTTDAMIGLGDAALQTDQPQLAVRWYARAAQQGAPLAFDARFRYAVLAVQEAAAGREAALAEAQRQQPAFTTYEILAGQSLRIPGPELRWMTPFPGLATYGDPLSVGTGGGTTWGYMWWSGRASAVVRVERDNRYVLQLRLLHSPPAPIKVAVGVDGRQTTVLTLDKGNFSEETYTVPVTLASGLHTVDLWYINDEYAAGRDRNAAVQWINIEEQK